RLEHGKPLLFGPPDDRRAVIMQGVTPKVVRAKDVPESSLWVHDEKNVNAAKLIADLFAPDFPIPIGVLAAIGAPVYEDLMVEQEQNAITERGLGDIAKLLTSGDTWKISYSAARGPHAPEWPAAPGARARRPRERRRAYPRRSSRLRVRHAPLL